MALKVARCILFVVLYAAPATVGAISLADFEPRASKLTLACEQAYTKDITSCQQSDFEPTPHCSYQCATGLVEISALIDSACRGDASNHQLLVGEFLDHHGPGVLCPNINFNGDIAATPGLVSSPSSGGAATQASSNPGSPTPATTTSAEITRSTFAPSSSTAWATPTPRITSIPMSMAMTRDSATCTKAAHTSSLLSTSSSSPTTIKTTITHATTTIAAPSSADHTPTSTQSPMDAAQSQAASAAHQRELCEKGDLSQHGGSLLDNYCGLASQRSVDLVALATALGVVLLGTSLL